MPAPRALSRVSALVVGVLVFATISARAGRAALPDGVPNIFDPKVQAQFQPVGVTNLGGSPDFPAVLFQDTVGAKPQTLLVAAGFMDKGKATRRYTEVAGVDAAALRDLLKAVFAATTQTYI